MLASPVWVISFFLHMINALHGGQIEYYLCPPLAQGWLRLCSVKISSCGTFKRRPKLLLEESFWPEKCIMTLLILSITGHKNTIETR